VHALIAGVAFEFIRLSGRYARHPIVRVLVWPGLQFQRLTTREPDLTMCEIAIAALERVAWMRRWSRSNARATAFLPSGFRPMMDRAMQEALKKVEERFAELDRLLSSPKSPRI